MTSPQSAIFREGTGFHWFQQFAIDPSSGHEAVIDAIRAIHTVAAGAAVHLLVAFGPELAPRLGLETPPDFRAFLPIGSGPRIAVATQQDVFLWIHSDAHDCNFDVALGARRAFGAIGSLARETPSFVYRDGRDLTGFIDGTENPSAEEGRDIAVIPDGLPGEGGSIVLAQRWVHDLDAFHALDGPDQEVVIGRTKDYSVELSEAEMPETAHVARVVMEDEAGAEIEIYRRSVPYGTTTEAGLYFLAFTNTLAKIDDMLRRMFGAGDDGVHDRLTEFSTTVSGAYYFAPSRETIDGMLA